MSLSVRLFVAHLPVDSLSSDSASKSKTLILNYFIPSVVHLDYIIRDLEVSTYD